MFSNINAEYEAKKRARREERLIAESVLGIEEVLPGSDGELDDVTDVDSVPEEVYKKVDAELDRIVSDPNYDDTEADELADDDLLEGDEDENPSEIDAIIDEACDCMPDEEDEDSDDDDDFDDDDLDEGCKK